GRDDRRGTGRVAGQRLLLSRPGSWCSSLLDHAPVRHVDVVAGLVPLDLDLRADLDRLGRVRVDPAQNREDAVAFLQVDVRGDERDLGRPATEGAVLDG